MLEGKTTARLHERQYFGFQFFFFVDFIFDAKNRIQPLGSEQLNENNKSCGFLCSPVLKNPSTPLKWSTKIIPKNHSQRVRRKIYRSNRRTKKFLVFEFVLESVPPSVFGRKTIMILPAGSVFIHYGPCSSKPSRRTPTSLSRFSAKRAFPAPSSRPA